MANMTIPTSRDIYLELAVEDRNVIEVLEEGLKAGLQREGAAHEPRGRGLRRE